MTDNEIIKALECCSLNIRACDSCPFEKHCYVFDDNIANYALDLINRLINNAKKDNRIIELQDKKIAEQKSEIESLNKNYEELIYKIETLLCYSTGNKFSKYTYTIQEMLSFVDDYIQDCCDEAIEETKANIKSEIIKSN